MEQRQVTIVGAGLAGSLMACMFARRGFRVDVYESGPDIRTQPKYSGKSINLALSMRGLSALHVVGLDQIVAESGIKMTARFIHATDGTTNRQPYGKPGQGILSVDRRRLNEMLLNHAEQSPNVKFHFNKKLEIMDPRCGLLRFTADPSAPAGPTHDAQAPGLIVGADGAYSAVRMSLLRTHMFGFHQRFLQHSYKELTIPPAPGGGFALETGVLHIWPRGTFMMIALPNQDHSFTVTLFQAYDTPEGGGWHSLRTDEQIMAFMTSNFPDAVPHMPTLLEDFKNNRTGPLVTATCTTRYHYKDCVVLVGDAAHGMVPFYGQGMNCAFEDCRVFDELLDRFDIATQRTELLEAYSAARTPNGAAISELALYNYVEMRHHTASRIFRMRSALDGWLHRLMPERWTPLYTMVTFSLRPYAEALEQKHRQDHIVNRVVTVIVVAVGLAGAWGGAVFLQRRGLLPSLAWKAKSV